MIELCLGLAAAALAAAGCLWLLRAPARWVIVFLIAAVALPPLPIAIGGSGPHPALLVALLGFLAGLFFLRAWRIPGDSLSRALIVFFFILLFSVAPAMVYSGFQVGVATLARVALFGVSVYIFFYVTVGPAGRDPANPLRATRLLFWAACASALFACLDFYFQFPAPAGFSDQYVWLDTGAFRRAQGLFYDASTLGNFCAFFLAMIAVALARPSAERPVSRFALVMGGVLFSAALVFSYSRASILNLLVAGAALLALHHKRVPFGRLMLIAAVATILVYVVAPAFVRLYLQRLGNTSYFFAASDTILSGRVSSWRALLDFLVANPWHALIGIGYKTLPYSDFTGGKVIADNMYLSLLVETGVAGLAALVWLHAAILRAAWRVRASFFGTWIFCFWCGEIAQMLSGDLFTYWRVVPLYFWVLATAVHENPVS
jgi:O-antigen ligase